MKTSGGDTFVELNTSDAESQYGFDAPGSETRFDGYLGLGWSNFIF